MKIFEATLCRTLGRPVPNVARPCHTVPKPNHKIHRKMARPVPKLAWPCATPGKVFTKTLSSSSLILPQKHLSSSKLLSSSPKHFQTQSQTPTFTTIQKSQQGQWHPKGPERRLQAQVLEETRSKPPQRITTSHLALRNNGVGINLFSLKNFILVGTQITMTW